MTTTPPSGLGTGGRKLWRNIVAEHDLDAAQLVQLTEACRIKDRLDRLDLILRGNADAMAVVTAGRDGELRLEVAGVAKLANESANLLKQLLAALRLPDASGRVPQYRGPRGAQKPSLPHGVSSLERARAAKTGS